MSGKGYTTEGSPIELVTDLVTIYSAESRNTSIRQSVSQVSKRYAEPNVLSPMQLF